MKAYQLSERNCQERCEEGLGLNEICAQLCSGVEICSSEGNCHKTFLMVPYITLPTKHLTCLTYVTLT